VVRSDHIETQRWLFINKNRNIVTVKYLISNPDRMRRLWTSNDYNALPSGWLADDVGLAASKRFTRHCPVDFWSRVVQTRNSTGTVFARTNRFPEKHCKSNIVSRDSAGTSRSDVVTVLVFSTETWRRPLRFWPTVVSNQWRR